MVLLIIARFRHFSEYYSAAAGVALLLKSLQALLLQFPIVLGCAAGTSNDGVATEVGVWRPRAGGWRQPYAAVHRRRARTPHLISSTNS
ncbi:hypothetical protein BZL30_7502 [Mycobacterium kansasii]|uniref:Uncharacterized protein n=1 Tax=Mycobacterium kansasii TaxID=1768 RepID=A0A1V3WKW7_MYCKA|nr:hypothetical protein BZL30_7502 [Mycobacterium kansasii]OOK83875.1 hypothetical protein BZL29_0346 [Mycobacterium kansasii]